MITFIILQDNQEREERKQKKKLDREREQQNARIEMLQQGKKPVYQRKCKYRNNENVSVCIVSKFNNNFKCLTFFCSSREKGS